jgi:hypothetical protein
MEKGVFYFTAREGGRNYIMATSRDGAVLWETPPFENEDRIAGNPLLTSTALFVPTLHYLYRLDLNREGLVTHVFPLPDPLRTQGRRPARFGNIIPINDYLVSVSEEDVILFKGVTE